jgi:hypothetical protein
LLVSLHTPSLQTLPDAEQLRGAPPQMPPVHWSVTVQNCPSLQVLPSGSGALHALVVSLHASAQFPSPSGAGQGLPVWLEQLPPLQVSVPLQNRSSLQGAVLFGCVQTPLPLHWSVVHGLLSVAQAVPAGSRQLSAFSLQMLAQSLPLLHGLPACTPQFPPLQVSAPLQNWPSVQALPSGSGAVQESLPSLQDSEQSPSPSGGGQGLPAWIAQLPPLQVSAPLQKRPSLQEAELLAWMQAPLPLHWSVVQGLPSLAQAVPAASKQLFAPSLQALAHSPPLLQGLPAWPQVPAVHTSGPLQN